MIGWMACSKAGHDKDKIYIIIEETDKYVWLADGDIRIAPFFFEASSEIIVSSVYSAGSAGALHEIVPMFGFDLVAADIAADCVANDHSCSSNSCFSFTPTRTPSTKPDFWWSLHRVQTG